MSRRVHITGLALAVAALCLSLRVFAQDAAPVPSPGDVQQVNVSVKIVEFQTTKGVNTGLSAYFKQRNKTRAWGRVSSGNGNVQSADLTFPTNTSSAITVFLDNITTSYGDIEVVLQALVDQNRAFILSQPKAMVTVGGAVPTTIKTTQKIPYEDTVVVGTTAVQTTNFRETGVEMTVSAPEIIDDDGNLSTNDDTYVRLDIQASVAEEGQRIVVALAEQVAQTGAFSSTSNAIQVPEFVSRRVKTTVWVRHGQVLLLGGLYRNTKNKNVSTVPWLTQGEDIVVGLANSLLPGSGTVGSPISAAVGNRSTEEGRRELVFLIKAELWRPAYALPSGLGPATFGGADEKKKSLFGVVEEISEIPQNIVEGIAEIPQGIVEGITGQTQEDDTSIDSHLGGDR
ncbi:MAG: hypothetical protein GWP08_14995 [Nitrospiraceae bacterium]|nr:hypothetical protein [Nitrospiraceae bacterium]